MDAAAASECSRAASSAIFLGIACGGGKNKSQDVFS